MSKMNDYYNVQNLYFDYYGDYSNYLKSYFVTFFLILMNFLGKGLCNKDIPFLKVVNNIQIATASVDFSSDTKDLPYAHFDAEAFLESNERVIEFRRQVSFDVKYNDFDDARKKSGQILHTIQDFYSHSNWVN